MIQKSKSSVSVLIAGVVMFAVIIVINVNIVHALTTIEDGCLDCHYRGSSIVPDTKQFENGTSWHTFHRNYSCSSCHPGSAGSKPISVASCSSCHDTTCAWQDFHENNQTYLDSVVGSTCAQCHQQCAPSGDADGDGIPDSEDNCPDTDNPGQEDTYPAQGNGIGDACECESDFACDGDVDADDVDSFLTDFGRFQFNNPCANDNQCNGDFGCDGDVDSGDVEKLMEDFGRFQFNNPCPQCTGEAWCLYP